MSSMSRLVGQPLLYAVFAVLIASGASSTYRHFPSDKAVIKLSFTHGAARASECRRLSADELARLPPNMRRATACERKRLPVYVEMSVDGAVLISEALPPTGFSEDGPSRIYRSFVVRPGLHQLVLRLRDTARESGFDYARDAEIELAPQQNFVVDFRPEGEGFIFR